MKGVGDMRERKRMIYLLVLVCGLFLTLIGYLTWFQLFKGDKLVSNPYNRRQWEKENNTIRGIIHDRNGIVLAKNKKIEDHYERVYPYGSLYSHVIGYNSRSYGRTMLEAAFNKELLGETGIGSVFNFNAGPQEERKGNNLYLSVDHRLQKLAEELLGDRNGAVVAMDPGTGEVLAMVSKPDFDPNNKALSEKWQDLVESEQHPFFPRATQGLYIPGSTYKMATAAAAVENGLDKLIFNDRGSVTIDGKVFRNFDGKSYGKIDVTKGFALSSNVVFSLLGEELGFDGLQDVSSRLGMGRELSFDLPVKQSAFPYKSMARAEAAAVGMGQGKLLVTPLHMAMITSCIANGGNMMRPRLVIHATDSEGDVTDRWGPSILFRALRKETAARVGAMMREVVRSGTGKRAAIRGIEVAGKTGTAENELSGKQRDREHAWFAGYAPYENPEIVVTVILEYGGSTGGKTAAPIARKLIQEYLNHIQ